MTEEKILYLKTLLQAMILQAEEITDFVRKRSEQEYCESRWDQKALAMSLQIIGENACKIAHHFPEYVQETKEVPWIEMRGLRNHISHGYDSLSQPRIWKIAVDNIPLLLKILKEKQKEL